MVNGQNAIVVGNQAALIMLAITDAYNVTL